MASSVPSDTSHNELWIQLFKGIVPDGSAQRLHDIDARPFGVVAALNLHGQFLVLWNDRRATGNGSGVYAQFLDTTARRIGFPWHVSSDTLISDEQVWLKQKGSETLLVWGVRARDGNTRYEQGVVDIAGQRIGTITQIEETNFDNFLTYEELPGAYIKHDTASVRFVHADGRVDPRLISSRFFKTAHYVSGDTSIVVLEQGPGTGRYITFYSSIFDTVVTRRVLFNVMTQSPDNVALARDSSGRIVVLLDELRAYVMGGGAAAAVNCRLIRCTLTNDDRFVDTVPLATAFEWLDENGSTRYSRGELTGSQVVYGDRNAARWTYNYKYGSYNKREDTGYSWERTTVLKTDRYGNLYTIDPAVTAYRATDARVRVAVTRLDMKDSSVVAVIFDSLTKRTVALPLPPAEQNFDQRSPAMMHDGNALNVVWYHGNKGTKFGAATWLAPSDSGIVQGLPLTFPSRSVNASRGERFEQNATLWRWQDACAVSYDEGLLAIPPGELYPRWMYSSYRLLVPSNTGWRTIDSLFDLAPFSTGPHGFDPDQRTIVGSVFQSVGGRYVATEVSGARLWTDTIRVYRPTAIVPLGGNRSLLVNDTLGWQFAGPVLVDSFRMTPAPVRPAYQCMLTGTFIRYWPNDGVDSNNVLRSRLISIETYTLSGTRVHTTMVAAPVERFDLFIYQRRSDSAFILLWGGDGVHMTILDKQLRLVLADTVISATRGSVRAPVCVVRGDTVYAAWEDSRNGAPDIYGRAWVFPSAVDTIERRPDIVVRKAPVWPNPAHDEVHIAYLGPFGFISIAYKVHDVAGRLVVEGGIDPTTGEGVWRCADVLPGIYLVGIYDVNNDLIATARVVKR